MRYNHAFDLAFEVISENQDDATVDEILLGLEKRLQYLINNKDQVKDSCNLYDSYEIKGN